METDTLKKLEDLGLVELLKAIGVSPVLAHIDENWVSSGLLMHVGMSPLSSENYLSFWPDSDPAKNSVIANVRLGGCNVSVLGSVPDVLALLRKHGIARGVV